MAANGKIHIGFSDPRAAETARAALEPDNDGHLEARVEGSQLVLSAQATTTLGLLRTLDDALGCLRALESAEQRACDESA